MSITLRLAVPVMLLLLVTAGGCATYPGFSDPTAGFPAPGDPAPPADVTITGVEEEVEFPAHFAGRVVVLSFFSPG